MRRPLIAAAAAAVALAALPAAAPAASNEVRIKKLEKRVSQLEKTVRILNGRVNSDRQVLQILIKEYICTPYLQLAPGGPTSKPTTNGAWLIPERDFGTLSFSDGSTFDCGAEPTAPAAARAAGADSGAVAKPGSARLQAWLRQGGDR